MREDTRQRVARIYGKEPETLDELAECIIALINTNQAVAGFSWNVRFVEEVSNSHSCPESGVTNWGRRKEGAPTHYLGLQGRVWIRYKEPAKSFGSEPFNGSLSHPGTGGRGAYDGPWANHSRVWHQLDDKRKAKIKQPNLFSWDYKIFLDDWPLVKQSIVDKDHADRVYATLANGQYKPVGHKILWQDPDVVREDKEILFAALSSNEVMFLGDIA